MASNYWMDRAVERATDAVARSKEAMRKAISRPILRRPNTRTLLEAAITDPASVDPSGRGVLAQFLTDTYGESARNIIPYLGAAEGEEDENELL